MTVIARRSRLAAAVAALCAAAVPSHAQSVATSSEWNLPTLMNAMRQVRASTARFEETRSSHLLNQAQHSSGRLIYAAPDSLAKETIAPAASRMTIAGDRLTIERPGEPVRALSLRDQSEVGALVESVRATLAGDLSALTRYFTAALTGSPDNWLLTLTPKDAKLRELVTAIRIAGQRTAIREIDTTEADGDRTTTAITPDPK